jgi:hypothetical protein
MNPNLKEELRILLISTVVCFGAVELMLWLSGADNTLFTPIKREAGLSLQLFCSIVFTTILYTCPAWRTKE